MNVTIIGTGYVGLVTGIGLAKLGHRTVCLDTDAAKIGTLNEGRLPIWEPGLEDALQPLRLEKKIEFTTDTAYAVGSSEILIIAVGTPSLADGNVNLSFLWDAIRSVSDHMRTRKLLVIKSTVPVGTTGMAERMLHQHRTNGLLLDVVHNPEFLRQGSAWNDFFHPDRIIAGCRSDESRRLIGELYAGLTAPIHYCSPQSAELIKYASNAFLAMKISYINMMAEMCERLDVSIDEVASGVGSDHRIGPDFLQAGIGYGGSCFPKDIRAMRKLSKEIGCETPLLDAVESVNDRQPERFVRRIADLLGGLDGRRVTLLGLSFKPETGDIREAPSLRIAELCRLAGADVAAYDPVVRRFPVGGVRIHPDAESALEGSDAAIVLTEWPEFRALDWASIRERMRTPVLADGRNLFSTEETRLFREYFGMRVLSVGRPSEIAKVDAAGAAVWEPFVSAANH